MLESLLNPSNELGLLDRFSTYLAGPLEVECVLPAFECARSREGFPVVPFCIPFVREPWLLFLKFLKVSNLWSGRPASTSVPLV